MDLLSSAFGLRPLDGTHNLCAVKLTASSISKQNSAFKTAKLQQNAGPIFDIKQLRRVTHPSEAAADADRVAEGLLAGAGAERGAEVRTLLLQLLLLLPQSHLHSRRALRHRRH